MKCLTDTEHRSNNALTRASDNVLLIKGGSCLRSRWRCRSCPPSPMCSYWGLRSQQFVAGLADLIAREEPCSRTRQTQCPRIHRRQRQVSYPGLRQCALPFTRRLVERMFRDNPARIVGAERAAAELSETHYRGDSCADVARLHRVLAQGITTVQDLATIYPFDEEHLDAMLKAYEDVGIRCVFALQVADVPGVKSIPFWDEIVPADQRGNLSGAVEPFHRHRLEPTTA